MKRIVVSACAALILASDGLPGPTGHASRLPSAGTMSIHIVSPGGAVTVPVNGKIPIRVRIMGMRLNMAAMGRKPVAGEGHFHFYVDCIPSIAYVKNNNLGACWAGAVASETTVFNLETSHVKVDAGPHTLFLALAQNDHVLYRVAPAAIQFTVTTPRMSIQAISPTQPVTVARNGKIPIRVRITGMRLNMAAMGRKPVAGEGHFHFYVDCIPSIAYVKNNNLGACWAGAVASETTVFNLETSRVKVTSGTHILLMALAQNDHVLYRIPAATIVFTVGH